MPLPTCECVKGLPIGEQLAAIYCATYTLAVGGDEGLFLLKSANLSDVDDPAASRNNLGAVSGIWPVTLGGTGQSVLYKFSAFKNADQAIVAGNTDKLLFQTEEYDVGPAFATSTFTAPVAGKYLFGAAAFSSGAPALQALYLYKNGSQFKRLAQRSVGGSDIISGSTPIELAVNDTVEVFMFSDQNANIVGASTITYFWGQLVP